MGEAASAETATGAALLGETVSAPEVEPPASSERVDVTGTTTLLGRVVLPAGMPADEELLVTARADASAIEARVSHDGHFELALPLDVARGSVELRGRYLYLDEPAAFDLEERDTCTLHPRLGARLSVDVSAPAELRSDAGVRNAVRVTANRRWGARVPDRAEPLDASWTATLDALPIDRGWTVDVEHPQLYDARKGPLSLEPGQHLRVSLELLRGTRLQGRVLHADGRPASGCEVTAQSLSDTGRRAVDVATLVTDADGTFVFEGQRPGLYSLTARSEGAVRARLDVERLADGAARTDLELVLGEGDRLAGRAVWPDGSPAAGAQVVLDSQYRASGQRVEVQVDADGRFDGMALSGPPYRARALASPADGDGTWRGLVTGLAPGTLDIELVLQPGNRVAGRVVDDTGAPLTRFKVAAHQVGRGNARGLERVDERFRDEDGRFVFDDLADGDWNLSASARGHGDGALVRLQLPDQAGAEWELVLPRTATVTGRVLGPDGAPLDGGSVRVPAGYSVKTTEVKADGTYRCEGLTAGRHELSARGNDTAWGASETVDLVPGEERAGVDLTVARVGRITGVLHASLSEREGRQVKLANADYTFNANATADAEGRFAFEGLAPDEYRVYLDFASRGGLNREWAEKYAARAEERVQLVEGADEHVVLGAPREGEVVVAGRLRKDGEPLANQLVYVYPGPEGMDYPVTVGYAGEDGDFELRLPGPGDYAFTSAPSAEFGFGRRLDVPDASPYELLIELGTGSIAGTLFGPDGEPRPKHSLILRRASAIPDSRRPGDMVRGATADDGSFAFANLEDGEWELRSGGFPGEHRTRSEGIAIVSGLVIEDGSALTGVELHLARGATLNGTCFTADGRPATGARVYVINDDGRQMLLLSGERVDWSGAFQVPSVEPGAFEVYAEQDGARSRTARVELGAGEERFVELVFE
jgi:hypothetical protein